MPTSLVYLWWVGAKDPDCRRLKLISSKPALLHYYVNYAVINCTVIQIFPLVHHNRKLRFAIVPTHSNWSSSSTTATTDRLIELLKESKRADTITIFNRAAAAAVCLSVSRMSKRSLLKVPYKSILLASLLLILGLVGERVSPAPSCVDHCFIVWIQTVVVTLDSFLRAHCWKSASRWLFG